MPISTVLQDPVARLRESVEREAGPPLLRRVEAGLARRPLLPLIALGITVVGLVLVVVLTVIAGFLSDNFATEGELAARGFRPWFRITLLTATNLMLTGIVTMLLAITVRIWWVTVSNQTFFPVAVDARRVRAGRAARYASRSDGDQPGGSD